MRRLKNFWWVLTNIHTLALMSENIHVMKLFKGVMDLIAQTAKEGKPMITKVALFNIADGTKLCDYVTLWAGAHDGNPLDRIEALRNQRDELKRQLSLFVDGMPEGDKKKILKLQIESFI